MNDRVKFFGVVAVALAGCAVAFALMFGVSAMGTRQWTDGRTIHLPASSRERDVMWTPAVPIDGEGFGDADEYDPRLSADGSTLIFARGRPGGNADLFLSTRTASGWGEPQPLAGINSESDELSPELSRDGLTLYFCSDRPGGLGGMDLWSSRRIEAGWSQPRNLGPEFNSEWEEHGVSITPDGSTLLFSSNRPRPGEARAASEGWVATVRERRTRHDYDLFSVALAGDASAAVRIAGINTSADEGAPAVSPAGDYLYFTSDRGGASPDDGGSYDVFRARIDPQGAFGEAIRLDASINSNGNELDPTLTHDGFTLYFCSDRAEPGTKAPAERSMARYSIWCSSSREVFVESVPGTNLAWQTLSELWPWLLMLALLAAILVLLVRLWRDERWRARFARLSLIAQCLWLSLLIHAALASLLTVWRISQGVIDLVAAEGGGQRVILGSGSPGGGIVSLVRSIAPAEASSLPEASFDVRPTIEAPAATPVRLAVTPIRETESAPLVPPRSIEPSALAVPEYRLSSEEEPTSDPARLPTSSAISAPPSEPALVDAPAIVPDAVPSAMSPLSDTSAALIEPRAMVVRSDVPIPSIRATRAISPDVPGVPVLPPVPTPSSAPTASLPVLTANAPPAIEPVAPSVSGELPASFATPIDSTARGPAHEIAHVVPVATDAHEPALRSIPRMRGFAGVPAGIEAPAIEVPERGASEPMASRLPLIEAPKPAAEGARQGGTLGEGTSLPTVSPGTESGRGAPAALVRIDATPSVIAPGTEAFRATDPSFTRSNRAAPDGSDRDLLSLVNDGSVGAGSPVVPIEDFAQRLPEVRDEMVQQMGGSAETERAVGRALEWFARHQSPDGRWSARGFDDGCGRCDGEAEISADAAMTGMALLCYLGAGHTHIADGPYKEAVGRGLRWLLARQESDGDLRQGETMYGQTVATVALCEALAMTRDQSLADPTRRAVALVLRRATEGRTRDERDTSVIGWLVFTVESARRAGIDVPRRTFESAERWLGQIMLPGDPGRYAYARGQPASEAMTAEAMFVRQLLGHQRSETMMQRSADFISARPPRWEAGAPTYYWYYATLALFQQQGEHWRSWNEALVRELLSHQVTEGAAAGSWAPQDEWSRLGGRVYQTAVCTLCLEVYYRYKARN